MDFQYGPKVSSGVAISDIGSQGGRVGALPKVLGGCHPPCSDTRCKERYKKGRLWAGRETIPLNELA